MTTNKKDTPQSLWVDGSKVGYDTPPPKKPDTNYQPAVMTLMQK